MPVVVSHVAGIPLEESILALLPVGGVLIFGARLWFHRLRQLVMRRPLYPRT